MDITKEDWEKIQQATDDNKDQIGELCIIVKGRPSARVKGLVDKVDDNSKDLKEIKKAVEEFVEERKRQRALTIGIAIGIGLNVVTGVATLSSIAQVLQAIATGVPGYENKRLQISDLAHHIYWVLGGRRGPLSLLLGPS